ncbi:MAG: cytochrome c oxidase subunit II, partial [Burkholderiales bacterium]
NISFDSYMIKDEDIKPNQKRLLEVDNRVVVPVDTTIRVLITGGDVMHSWAIPALGVKMDAVPGHTNETWFYIKKPGIYYGQCSELCGVGHAFMPIAIEAVSKEEFEAWLKSAKQKFSFNHTQQFVSLQ